MLTLRAKPAVKPPTPSPATRGLVSTPTVPNNEKPAKVYIAMAADFDANLQHIHAKLKTQPTDVLMTVRDAYKAGTFIG